MSDSSSSLLIDFSSPCKNIIYIPPLVPLSEPAQHPAKSEVPPTTEEWSTDTDNNIFDAVAHQAVRNVQVKNDPFEFVFEAACGLQVKTDGKLDSGQKDDVNMLSNKVQNCLVQAADSAEHDKVGLDDISYLEDSFMNSCLGDSNILYEKSMQHCSHSKSKGAEDMSTSKNNPDAPFGPNTIEEKLDCSKNSYPFMTDYNNLREAQDQDLKTIVANRVSKCIQNALNQSKQNLQLQTSASNIDNQTQSNSHSYLCSPLRSHRRSYSSGMDIVMEITPLKEKLKRNSSFSSLDVDSTLVSHHQIQSSWTEVIHSLNSDRSASKDFKHPSMPSVSQTGPHTKSTAFVNLTSTSQGLTCSEVTSNSSGFDTPLPSKFEFFKRSVTPQDNTGSQKLIHKDSTDIRRKSFKLSFGDEHKGNISNAEVSRTEDKLQANDSIILEAAMLSNILREQNPLESEENIMDIEPEWDKYPTDFASSADNSKDSQTATDGNTGQSGAQGQDQIQNLKDDTTRVADIALKTAPGNPQMEMKLRPKKNLGPGIMGQKGPLKAVVPVDSMTRPPQKKVAEKNVEPPTAKKADVCPLPAEATNTAARLSVTSTSDSSGTTNRQHQSTTVSIPKQDTSATLSNPRANRFLRTPSPVPQMRQGMRRSTSLTNTKPHASTTPTQKKSPAPGQFNRTEGTIVTSTPNPQHNSATLNKQQSSRTSLTSRKSKSTSNVMSSSSAVSGPKPASQKKSSSLAQGGKTLVTSNRSQISSTPSRGANNTLLKPLTKLVTKLRQTSSTSTNKENYKPTSR